MPRMLSRNYNELEKWLSKFVATLEPHLAEFQMTEDDLDGLKSLDTAFIAAVEDYREKERALSAASSTRKDLRRAVMQDSRPIIDRINHHPAMTNGLRSQLGLRPTNLEPDLGTPIWQLKPLVHLEAFLGRVAVHWGPNPGNERMNGKPDGVKSAIIYRKAADEEKYQVVGYATRSPYYDSISGPATDYTYVVRYRGTEQTDLSNESRACTVAARGELAA